MTADHRRKDVMAEVVPAGSGMIGAQLFEEERPGETVDPHRGQAHSGLAGEFRGVW